MSDAKVVFVTGASRGIGAALAVHFAKEGYCVAANYLSSQEQALAVEKEINRHSECLLVRGDVSSLPDVEAMVELIKERFGRIDVLINNAGMMAN